MAVHATREVRQDLHGAVAPQDIRDNSGLGVADTDYRGCNMEERHVGEDGPRGLGDVRVGHLGTHEMGVREDQEALQDAAEVLCIVHSPVDLLEGILDNAVADSCFLGAADHTGRWSIRGTDYGHNWGMVPHGCNTEGLREGEDGPQDQEDEKAGHQGTHEMGVQGDERVGRRLKAGAPRVRNVGVGVVSVETQWKQVCWAT